MLTAGQMAYWCVGSLIINAMANSSGLRLCTYNCRSIKSSLYDVKLLCDNHDIVFVQEHWLLPFELSMLSSIHSDFHGFGVSAVDTSVDLLVGRPYGGTAILYRKHLASATKIVNTYESRITAITIESALGPILFVNVYMPTDYGDSDCLDSYLDICSKISSLFTDTECAFLVIAGDFNCDIGSRFYPMFLQLAEDNDLAQSDLTRLGLTNVFTYCSDSGLNLSWIDHVVCSRPVDRLITSVNVLCSYISSDHKPLSIHFESLTPQSCSPAERDVYLHSNKPCWDKVEDCHLLRYADELNVLLSNIDIPKCLLYCNDVLCTNQVHLHAIDAYYNSIITAVSLAVDDCIPLTNTNRQNNNFIVPGWSEYVDEKHEVAREAFLDWVLAGKPRAGALVIRMRRTRASFKLALRYCKQHEDQIRADACAESMQSRDSKSFWRNVYKISNNKATKYATAVGGAVGDDAIANLWKDHFQQLYSSVSAATDKQLFTERITSANRCTATAITMDDIRSAIGQQKKNKAAGPDGLQAEAFIYGQARLYAHLSILFGLFCKHQYVPVKFAQSTIVPLVKCKGGDLTDVNNYRAIMLSNSITKILEVALSNKLTADADCDAYQFGFKKNHSTGHCTGLLKQTVEYYTKRGSHVFVCFVDFKKAFDRVNYWKLFNKLIDDGISVDIIALLSYWYSHQDVNVRWHNHLSDSFSIENGTRQGGILSPYLFIRYIRELLYSVINTRIGCNVGGMMMNILAYADDIALLAPSWAAMQCLIEVLAVNIGDIDMICNIDKTVCMVFKPSCRNKIVSQHFPCFTMLNRLIQYVTQFRYLGHILNNEFADDDDIKREIRNLFVRTNLLNRRFSRCSVSVKLSLFKAYCLCLYDAALWNSFASGTMDKLNSCYNKCIKIFFGYSRYYSVTAMLSELGLPTLTAFLANCRMSFLSRWNTSISIIVKHFVQLLP